RATPNTLVTALARGRTKGTRHSRGVSCARCLTPCTSSCSSRMRSVRESGGSANSGATRSRSRGTRRRPTGSATLTVSLVLSACSMTRRAVALSWAPNGQAPSAPKPPANRSKCRGSRQSAPADLEPAARSAAQLHQPQLFPVARPRVREIAGLLRPASEPEQPARAIRLLRARRRVRPRRFDWAAQLEQQVAEQLPRGQE